MLIFLAIYNFIQFFLLFFNLIYDFLLFLSQINNKVFISLIIHLIVISLFNV